VFCQITIGLLLMVVSAQNFRIIQGFVEYVIDRIRGIK
jgi:hypothetical protein